MNVDQFLHTYMFTELIFSDNEVDKRVSALAFWTSPSPHSLKSAQRSSSFTPGVHTSIAEGSLLSPRPPTGCCTDTLILVRAWNLETMETRPCLTRSSTG
jgi:hypothetical protein